MLINLSNKFCTFLKSPNKKVSLCQCSNTNVRPCELSKSSCPKIDLQMNSGVSSRIFHRRLMRIQTQWISRMTTPNHVTRIALGQFKPQTAQIVCGTQEKQIVLFLIIKRLIGYTTTPYLTIRFSKLLGTNKPRMGKIRLKLPKIILSRCNLNTMCQELL